MIEDFVECYDTLNTKVCPDELIFGDFHDQSIPHEYYDFLNDNYDDENDTTDTPVENVFPDNKGGEYSAMKKALGGDSND